MSMHDAQVWRIRPGLVGPRHPQHHLLVSGSEGVAAVMDQVRERDGPRERHARRVVPVRSGTLHVRLAPCSYRAELAHD